MFADRLARFGLVSALLAGAALLSSCGGGGGGGDGGGNDDAFTVSSTSVTFNAQQGGATPPPQVVTVTVLRGTVFLATSQTGAAFGHTFTIIPPVSAQITITPGSTTTAGTFTGIITVTGCSNAFGPCNQVAGSPKTINVTYNVAGLSTTPGQLDFSATTGMNPSSKTVTLAVAGGSTPWTSSIGYSPSVTNWLSISPTSGAVTPSTPQTVTFNVNTAGLTAGVYNATVGFQGTGLLTASVAVSLTVGDPSVDFVAPYVVASGSGGNVIIRGRGFSALNAGALSVQFNATPASAATIVSDTEIQASYPALTAGNYSISVGDSGGTITSRGALKLVVIDPPSFSATTFSRAFSSPNEPSNLIYDAERQAVLLIDRGNNRIERYAFNGTSWPGTQATIGGGGGNPSIALSPDGTELLKTGATGNLLHRVNPATLALLSSVDSTSVLGAGSLNFIAFANDGGAVGNSTAANNIYLYRYDMLTQRFTALSTQFHMLNRQIFASADGDTLLLPNSDAGSTDKRAYTYDASGGTLSPSSVSTSTQLFRPGAVSRNGSRLVLVNETFSSSTATVYNASFIALGVLPVGTDSGFAFSPDSNFVYAYYPASGKVRKFDLNSSSGGIFTEVGSGVTVATSGTSLPELAISPDGSFLFGATSTQILIFAAP